MVSTATAPAKIILLGEHFCVHGSPALSMAVNLHAKVKVKDWNQKGLYILSKNFEVEGIYRDGKYFDLKGGLTGKKILNPVRLAVEEVLKYSKYSIEGLRVEVDSKIPVGVGFGSSAAISVSTIMAVAQHLGLNLSRKEICRLAYASERYVHFNPSGVDQTTSTYGGIILYKLGSPIQSLKLKKQPIFVVGNTGIRRITGKFVKKVDKLKRKRKKLVESMLETAEKIVLEAVKALKNGDWDKLGSLMNENQKILSNIGVSHPKLDLLINAAKNAGALGAKLTGGGGGGCMIALVKPKEWLKVAQAIRNVGGEVYKVKTDWIGVKTISD
mgnify:CR=1 FL=1